MNETQIKGLMELGLSKLQARIYLALYLEPGQTGYKIAQGLNEPSANTYKALELLLKKGIILLDETGTNKKYSAMPIENYLNQLEIQFKTKRAVIENKLKNIKPVIAQEGIFRIENINQLYENAKAIINNAKEVLALDCSIPPLEILKQDLETAAQNGVKVIVKTSADISIPGCDIIYSKEMSSTINELPIQYLNICNPGMEHLIALLNNDNSKVVNAVLSRNRFQSIVAYNGIASEFILAKLLEMLIAGKKNSEILIEWEKADTLKPSRSRAMNDIIKAHQK